MDINQLQQQFSDFVARRNVFRHAITVLNYDAETALPAKGAEQYARVLAELAAQSYQLLISDEHKQLVAEILQHGEQVPLWMRRECEEQSRQIKKLQVIPAAEYRQAQEDFAASTQAWLLAKSNSDFAAFAPHLRKVLNHSIRFARLYDSSRPVYDVMLEDYEQGLTTAQLDVFFAELRQRIVPLMRQIATRPEPEQHFLQGNFPVHLQQQLGHQLMQMLGLAPDVCTLAASEHPFSTFTHNRDVRITTHYYEKNLLSSIYSVIHEGGHALYMSNTADELLGTELAEGASCSIHESVSRFYENYIGRSREFTALLLPRLKEIFPNLFDRVSAEQFYRAVNCSSPGLIRVEADELTYPLHIMVRYELEKQLVNGTLAIEDLPAAWNELYAEYLGVAVPDDAHGVLQDTHWSSGSFGYFPTYALGSAYAAQILDAMQQQLPVSGLVANGRLEQVTAWLQEKLFHYGGIKTADQLLREITGRGFDPACYVDYLSCKFKDIYQLD